MKKITLFLLTSFLLIAACTEQPPASAETEIKTIKISLPELPADATNLSEEYVQALVDQTETEKLPDYKRAYRSDADIFVPYSIIHAFYQEENKLKVFATTTVHFYNTNHQKKAVTFLSGGTTPVAITYFKNNQGKYILEQYQEARDGADHRTSVEEYCTMPVSGKKIEGLANKILKPVDKALYQLQQQRLINILNNNGLTGYSLANYDGSKTTALN